MKHLFLSFLTCFLSLLFTLSVNAETSFQSLRLTGMHACEESRVFRVRNNNAFDVEYSWRSLGSGESGNTIASPGDNFIHILGGNTTLIIRWNYNGNSGSQTKASNNQQNCPLSNTEPDISSITDTIDYALNVDELPSPVFDDGRCNPDPWASAVLYETSEGYEMFGVIDSVESNGYSLFTVPFMLVERAQSSQNDEAILLGGAETIYGGIVELWLLSSGELQIHAHALPSHTHFWYDYIFSECEGNF